MGKICIREKRLLYSGGDGGQDFFQGILHSFLFFQGEKYFRNTGLSLMCVLILCVMGSRMNLIFPFCIIVFSQTGKDVIVVLVVESSVAAPFKNFRSIREEKGKDHGDHLVGGDFHPCCVCLWAVGTLFFRFHR